MKSDTIKLSYRELAKGYEKVILLKDKEIAGKDEIIQQLKELVKFTEISAASGLLPNKTA